MAEVRENEPSEQLSEAEASEAARRYLEAVERITGAPFVPNLEEPLARMQRNVSQYLAGSKSS